MSNIRKPGTHPGPARTPGTRPIALKTIRNSLQRRQNKMTIDFISNKLTQTRELAQSQLDPIAILNQLSVLVTKTAQSHVDEVNTKENLDVKIVLLHRCIITIMETINSAAQNVSTAKIRYQSEINLLNRLIIELKEFNSTLPEEGSAEEEEIEEKSDEELDPEVEGDQAATTTETVEEINA